MGVDATIEKVAPKEIKTLDVLNGLTVKEAVFVREYIANGGNGSKAVMVASPNYKPTSATVQACEYLRKDSVKKALQQILSITASAEYVKTKFMRLSQDDKDDNLQLKATRELGRVLGLYGDESGRISGAVNVTFNMPGVARDPVKQPIDITEE